MKKILVLIIMAFLIFTTVGCLNKIKEETGTIALEITPTDLTAQTLLPNVDMTIATYEISGVGPNGATFSDTGVTGNSYTKNLLPFGTWTITVNAKNANGILIGQGQDTVVVHVGQTTTANVVVKPLTGLGTLDLTVNWNAQDTENPTITSQLIPPTGTPMDLAFQITNGNNGTYVNNAINNGYYSVVVQLKDSGQLTMGAVEVVRIVKDAVTAGTFDFTQINGQGGNILVNITPEMADPINVTMTGQQNELPSNGSMTVTASVPSDVGNVVYVWYINGESKATGPSYTVNGLAEGIYRLDVTAFTTDGKRAGSATHTFNATSAMDYSNDSTWAKSYSLDGSSENIYSGVISSEDNIVLSGTRWPSGLIFTLDNQGNEIWSKTYGSGHFNRLKSIQKTSDGGLIAASSSVTNQNEGFGILKLDVSGNVQWAKVFDDFGADVVNSIVETSDGNFILAGNSTSCEAQNWGAMFVKIDAMGNVIWSKVHEDWDNAVVYSVYETSDGGYFAVGDYSNYRVLVMKIASNGDLLWSKIVAENIRLSMAIKLRDGNFIILGSTDYSALGQSDYFVMKVDANGNPLWSKLIGGDLNDFAPGICETINGNFIIADKDEDKIVKIDALGNLVWEKSLPINSWEEGILRTSDGDYVGFGYHMKLYKVNQFGEILGASQTVETTFKSIDYSMLTTELTSLKTIDMNLTSTNISVPVTDISLNVSIVSE